MKISLLILSLFLFGSLQLAGQDVPGLSYCLLFDSYLEKQAFQESDECDPLVFLLAYDPKIDSSRYMKVKKELSGYATKLQDRKSKFKSESKFLHSVFTRIHDRYLKIYKTTETFNGIFVDGTYNCVSGTALYAYMLNQLGYSSRIVKTRYHIFLLVSTQGSDDILFETTDSLSGFVENKEVVNERIKHYLSAEKVTLSKQKTLSAPFNDSVKMEDISLKELAGLQYYNIAIDYMNKENYYDAFRMLKKAGILYPKSDCIRDFRQFSKLKYAQEITSAFDFD